MTPTCIVVPCYNEANRLDAAVFARFARSTPEVRFLFVDDGSTDETLAKLGKLAEARPEQLGVLRLARNGGKAEAVRQGVHAAMATGATYVGYWDADLAAPLDAIHALSAVLDRAPHIQLVMGSRVQLLGRRIERRAARHYLGRVFATAASIVLGLRVYDTQCGAKLFRNTPELAALFAAPFRSRWIFDVELLARLVSLHRRQGTADAASLVYEEPLTEWSDVGGSKLRIRDFVVAFADLARIHTSLRGKGILVPVESDTRAAQSEPEAVRWSA